MIQHRSVYRVRKTMRERERDVLLSTWSGVAFCAVILAREGRSRLARDYAADARQLIQTFGVRWDGKPVRREAR